MEVDQLTIKRKTTSCMIARYPISLTIDEDARRPAVRTLRKLVDSRIIFGLFDHELRDAKGG